MNFIKKNYYKNYLRKREILKSLRPLITAGLLLMKSVPTPLSKHVLIPSRLSAGMSAADAAIQKNIYRSGRA